jgi:hypothetical protein
MRGFEPMCPGVLVGRIYPLVDIEAGFLILNLKKTKSLENHFFEKKLFSATSLRITCNIIYFFDTNFNRARQPASGLLAA